MLNKLMTIALTAGLLSGCASYDAIHHNDQVDALEADSRAHMAEFNAMQARDDARDADYSRRYWAWAMAVAEYEDDGNAHHRKHLKPPAPLPPEIMAWEEKRQGAGGDHTAEFLAIDLHKIETQADQQADFDQVDEGLLRAQLGLDD